MPRKPKTPTTVDDYVAVLKKDRRVDIPCPHGEGRYVIDIRRHNYLGTPEIAFFDNTNRLRAAPAFALNSKDRVVVGEPLMAARAVIGAILAGRRVHALSCGAVISSTNKFP